MTRASADHINTIISLVLGVIAVVALLFAGVSREYAWIVAACAGYFVVYKWVRWEHESWAQSADESAERYRRASLAVHRGYGACLVVTAIAVGVAGAADAHVPLWFEAEVSELMRQETPQNTPDFRAVPIPAEWKNDASAFPVPTPLTPMAVILDREHLRVERLRSAAAEVVKKVGAKFLFLGQALLLLYLFFGIFLFMIEFIGGSTHKLTGSSGQ